MKIGIIGSGVVGKTLASGYAAHGHEVVVGTREPSREDVLSWLAQAAGSSGSSGSTGSVRAAPVLEAAAFGEIVVLATAGSATAEVALVIREQVHGKAVIDATNPLGHTDAGPHLTIAGDDSLGELVARTLPDAHVVKAYNTVGAPLMVDPQLPGGPPMMCIAGDDDVAKQQVTKLLEATGWDVADLGGIGASRWLEAMAMAWVVYGITAGTWNHAFRLLRA